MTNERTNERTNEDERVLMMAKKKEEVKTMMT